MKYMSEAAHTGMCVYSSHTAPSQIRPPAVRRMRHLGHSLSSEQIARLALTRAHSQRQTGLGLASAEDLRGAT